MPKFRKKSVVIEAWQWDESQKTLNKIGCQRISCSGRTDNPDLCCNLRIETKEGIMHVEKDDWIIKEVVGEYYPCKLDIFKQTYEPA